MQAVKFKLEIWQSRVVQRFYKHIMQVSFETSVVKGQLELIRQRLEDPPPHPTHLSLSVHIPSSPLTLHTIPHFLAHCIFILIAYVFSIADCCIVAKWYDAVQQRCRLAVYMHVKVLHSCIGFAMLFFQHVCQCFRLVVIAPMRAFY